MPRPHILLVSHHFYPSNAVGAKRPSETAIFLRQKGFRVTVLRAAPVGGYQTPDPPELGGMEVITVRTSRKRLTEVWMALKRRRRPVGGASAPTASSPGSDEASAPDAEARGRSLLRWLRRQALSAETLFDASKWWILKGILTAARFTRRERIDLVMASGPPMSGCIVGYAAARLARAPFVLDLRDPWLLQTDPERRTEMRGHPLARLEDAVATRCVAGSTSIVVASPGIERHARRTFPVDPIPISVVRNGFDEDARVDVPPPLGSLVMLYTGSLYWNRNPFPFLEAVHALVSRPDVIRGKVELTLLGNCNEWGGVSVAAWLRERGLEDVVKLVPPVDRQLVPERVAASNVLVNFAQGQARQIPAKSYEYLASQRHVLTIAEDSSDVAALFREAGVGRVVEPGDGPDMLDALLEAYRSLVVDQSPSRRPMAELEQYGRERQLERLAGVLRETLGEQSRTHSHVGPAE